MTLPPILVQTCEDHAPGRQRLPLLPSHGEDDRFFCLQDPFGIRKAIVPVFRMGLDGDLQGFGTAFAIDPWGHFITADHVVAEVRNRATVSRQQDGWTAVMPRDESLVLILSFGLAFGTVAIPPTAMVRISKTWSPAFEGDDPLAALDGSIDVKPVDLCFLTISRPASGMVANLPFVSRPTGPRVGDVVVAIGFPGIKTFRGDADQARTIIEDGMFVSCG